MRAHRHRRRGSLVLFAVVLLPILLLAAGLVVDGALLYLTDVRLSAAVRGAAHSALRGADPAEAEQLARAVFDANFPAGILMSHSRRIESFRLENGRVRLTASAQAPTLFMRLLGREVVELRRTAEAAGPKPGAPVHLLADSDAFGHDLAEIQDLALRYPGCGGGSPAVCVNADQPGEAPLFSRGRDITPYENFSPHAGSPVDPAFFNPDGAALSPAGMEELVGRTVCVEVYQGEIEADATREIQGHTAFTVTGLTPAPEGRSANPHWIVRLLPANSVAALCANQARP